MSPKNLATKLLKGSGIKDTDKEIQLAIVIPAYKGRFLADTLQSLANQTDKRFRVYIGNDASPDSLGTICRKFMGTLEILYQEFDNNLGRTSLIDQWNRCVALSQEKWVCLFSDDDIMDPNCVEGFYRAILDAPDDDIFRFDTRVISSKGETVRDNVPHPDRETASDFALERLAGARDSFVSEYIFRRTVYDKNNGFVKFPAAWCSDDASFIAFSGSKGIPVIRGTKVGWRLSEENITSIHSSFKKEKIIASLQYVKWLDSHVFKKDLVTEEQYQLFRDRSEKWFLNHLWKISPKLTIHDISTISRDASRLFFRSRFFFVRKLLLSNYRSLMNH